MASGHASGEAVVTVTLVMTSLAAFFSGMRLYARFGVGKKAGADDACIVLSMLFAIATTITMIIQVRTGMGRHQWEIEPEDSMTNLKAFYVSIWVYNLSLTFTKISIIIQYLRLFPQKTFRICAWTLMGVTIAYGLYVFLTAIFSCWPIAFFWDHTIPGGKCLPRFAVWFANSGLNIVTDVATATLPLPVLNNLELPRRQKRALMLVFALGGFTCIVSVLRLQSLYVISRTEDVSWNNGLAAIWSNVEMNIAIICSCLPTIRCMFPTLFKSQMSLSGSGHGGASAGGSRGGGSRHVRSSRRGDEADHDTNGVRSRPTIGSFGSFGSSIKVPLNTSVTVSSPTSYHSFEGTNEGRGDDGWHAFGKNLHGSQGRRKKRGHSTEEIEMVDSLAEVPDDRTHMTTANDQAEETRPGSPTESDGSIKDVSTPSTYHAI